ncbi:hypothetical protein L1286_09425 [Pseudoalteromonas sp. SMS1]|uniref:hypothetical protein n=1 Tax=Pseudoalteromonas sp. SMS1 TaxID=2908894 RepID=UPI001F4149D2|nr:hypothetical protein [Pseudoalteromonas sp. SMS1]MCF2857691.1 hypothetical protein [Pseudoalteromonas sp. SMS1]
MKKPTDTFKKELISPDLWALYQDVYFSLFHASQHYLDGAIISLWNPGGKLSNKSHNRLRVKKYIALLSRQNKKIKFLYGGNQNMSYRELSISINTSLPTAQKLALRCHQKAFYYLHNGEITLYNSTCLEQSSTLNRHLLSRLGPSTLPQKNLALSVR